MVSADYIPSNHLHILYRIFKLLKQGVSTMDPVYDDDNPLYDPLMGLYPFDTPERQQGLLRVIDPELMVMKPVIVPMHLYPLSGYC
jgi:hypothetical protein